MAHLPARWRAGGMLGLAIALATATACERLVTPDDTSAKELAVDVRIDDHSLLRLPRDHSEEELRLRVRFQSNCCPHEGALVRFQRGERIIYDSPDGDVDLTWQTAYDFTGYEAWVGRPKGSLLRLVYVDQRGHRSPFEARIAFQKPTLTYPQSGAAIPRSASNSVTVRYKKVLDTSGFDRTMIEGHAWVGADRQLPTHRVAGNEDSDDGEYVLDLPVVGGVGGLGLVRILTVKGPTPQPFRSVTEDYHIGTWIPITWAMPDDDLRAGDGGAQSSRAVWSA